MAGGIESYGSAMGKAPGGGATPIKAPPTPKLAPAANMGGTRQVGGVRPPAPVRREAPFGPPPALSSQAPTRQVGDRPMVAAPGAAPSTPESRAAARAKLYAPDGAGWGSFGGAPPDPVGGGFAGGVGQQGMTGGGFMAPPPPMDPMQVDLMGKIRALAQTNPQVYQQIMALIG